jgi:hypothetical protein
MVEWSGHQAVAEVPVLGASDNRLIEQMLQAEWIGIDAPLGWPDDFVAAVHGYTTSGAWPAELPTTRMRHRDTDRFVHEVVAAKADKSLWPLSVSSDRIAVCAWRCARLLSRYAAEAGWHVDRIGVPRHSRANGAPQASGQHRLVAPRGVVEVYPAAALALWGLEFKGYKSGTSTSTAPAAAKRRAEILHTIQNLAAPWLSLPDDVRNRCATSDDCLDSLVAAFVAFAAAVDRTLVPTGVQHAAAQREGWIHLPAPRQPVDARHCLDLTPNHNAQQTQTVPTSFPDTLRARPEQQSARSLAMLGAPRVRRYRRRRTEPLTIATVDRDYR